MKFILFISKILSHILFRVRIHNKDKIICDGPIIFCANHLSNWDPILMYLYFPREIIFMAKKELFEIKPVKWLFNKLNMIPVDRKKPELSSIKDSISVLKNDKALGVFPQGTRKKYINIDDAKAGVGLIVYKANTGIQPIYIKSKYKLFSKVEFYVGDPIYPETGSELTSKELYDKMSKDVMITIKEMADASNLSWWIRFLLWS